MHYFSYRQTNVPVQREIWDSRSGGVILSQS